MRPPSAGELLRAWELGDARPPWFRALVLLALATPQARFIDLARLSLGRRNLRIAGLRRSLFGEDLTAVCPCPRCGTVAEFGARVGDLAPETASTAAEQTFEVETPAGPRRWRAPTSEDLAALRLPNAGAVRLHDRDLVRRCLEVEGAWPAPVDEVLAAAVVEAWYVHDPGIETDVELSCDACGEGWRFAFDWPGFTWSELAAAARRHMGEVDVLARAYGWRETDVLSLGPARRRFYLERAAS